MAVKLIYQMFTKLLSWMVLHARSNTANEIEILVLRHQLAVLQRRTPRPQISWTDRAVIAALARLLPPRRRRGFLVTRFPGRSTPLTIRSRSSSSTRSRTAASGDRTCSLLTLATPHRRMGFP
jgi:hypothetical protein